MQTAVSWPEPWPTVARTVALAATHVAVVVVTAVAMALATATAMALAMVGTLAVVLTVARDMAVVVGGLSFNLIQK